jgi:hypothetical protein
LGADAPGEIFQKVAASSFSFHLPMKSPQRILFLNALAFRRSRLTLMQIEALCSTLQHNDLGASRCQNEGKKKPGSQFP